MIRKTLCSALALGLLGASAVQAQDYDDRFYIAPSVGFLFADSGRDTDNGALFGLGFGKFRRARRTKEHGHRQTIGLHRRDHGMSHIPRVVPKVTQHGQPSTRVVAAIKIRSEGPLAEVGKAIGYARLSFGLAERGQEQPGQNCDNGDDNEQFDEGECQAGWASHRSAQAFCWLVHNVELIVTYGSTSARSNYRAQSAANPGLETPTSNGPM